jgi:leader peptidase (prepilin peptidase) / N-methyltransferase
MSIDPHEVRRIDIGAGIYVRVPARREPGPAGGEDRPARPAGTQTRAWSLPTVALAVGAALVPLALLRLGLTPRGILAAGLLPVLAALAAIDLRSRLLPNRIVLPSLALVLAWQIAFSPGRTGEWLLAAGGAALFLLLPSLARRGAIGMGDVKLAALLGAALGADVRAALLLGFLALTPAALVVLIRRGRQATLPLGPCLALGGALVLLA